MQSSRSNTFDARGGETPRGTKGVDSSPSLAGIHPPRNAVRIVCLVPNSVTPDSLSYFLGMLEPGSVPERTQTDLGNMALTLKLSARRDKNMTESVGC